MYIRICFLCRGLVGAGGGNTYLHTNIRIRARHISGSGCVIVYLCLRMCVFLFAYLFFFVCLITNIRTTNKQIRGEGLAWARSAEVVETLTSSAYGRQCAIRATRHHLSPTTLVGASEESDAERHVCWFDMSPPHTRVHGHPRLFIFQSVSSLVVKMKTSRMPAMSAHRHIKFCKGIVRQLR
jgi:hypothetical protein